MAQSITTTMNEHEIVPDVIPVAPSDIIEVKCYISSFHPTTQGFKQISKHNIDLMIL